MDFRYAPSVLYMQHKEAKLRDSSGFDSLEYLEGVGNHLVGLSPQSGFAGLAKWYDICFVGKSYQLAV